MTTLNDRVKAAIADLKAGKMIVLTDHVHRENEGDLVIPGETVTPEQMNFLIRHGTGIVCLAMTAERLAQLSLPLMVSPQDNTSLYHTPFTIPVDARCGITTGVSAADRTHTIHLLIDNNTQPEDLVKPGHVFPLQAKNGGVLKRQGHTEGSTDLVKLAGFKPAAVLCEIMNPDGTMAKGLQLNAFAKTHGLTMISIDDIVSYRLLHENQIAEEATAIIPLEKYGNFNVTIIKEKITEQEQLIAWKETVNTSQPPLVRIHSACTTGDLFSSNRCDCNKQFHYSLQRISAEGGLLIYLNQEGRGIGLFNKIKAYALQEKGFDTVQANEELGLPIDSRHYAIAANILRNRGIQHIRLMTNNLEKISDLKKYGIQQVDRELMPSFHNEHNHRYLTTKKTKLNHAIDFNFLPNLLKESSQ